MDITISEIKAAKKEAETKIAGALLEFRIKTGLDVNDVNHMHLPEKRFGNMDATEKYNVFLKIII